ncbi:MAG TPA: hypothetical protein VIA18_08460 [Polyangia bacterium]|jgi:hypothetical protein|nr:hypothetical protein [Polyangia bacterium]
MAVVDGVVDAIDIGVAVVAEAGAIAAAVLGAAPATEAIRAAAATDETGSRRAVRRRNIYPSVRGVAGRVKPGFVDGERAIVQASGERSVAERSALRVMSAAVVLKLSRPRASCVGGDR